MSYTAAVLTISDKGSRRERIDTSGPALCEILQNDGYSIVHTEILPDEGELIKAALERVCDEMKVDLLLTTGGTGFSPRDVTPEAALAVIERLTPGLPEAMRAESMRITPHGCLSRSVAGIRGKTLIVTLPGSEKAARENISAVLSPIRHGLKMLASSGSAECASQMPIKQKAPSMDAWMRQAKADPIAAECGMFLFHNGVVRETAKAQARFGESSKPVVGMEFSYDRQKLDAAIAQAKLLPGIFYVRVWLNEGRLNVGDDIMLVLIGGDIRPHVVDALQTLVGTIKNECVCEKEVFE